MERRTEFNLDLAINRYVSQVNSSNSLSREDEDELTDHLLSEIETLEKIGLSTEEAFIVSEKRLGQTEIISKEYRKANPWSRILQLLASAVVFIFGFKIIFNLTKIASIAVIAGLSFFSEVDVESYMVWGDLALQICVLLGAICLGVFFMKRLIVRNLIHYWPIPLVFLFSELLKVGFLPFAISNGKITSQLFGASSLNGQYIYLGWIVITVIASLWIILKNKDQRIRLA